MKTYKVMIGGLEHTLQLSEDDAKRYGATEVKASEPSSNKARGAKNKSA